MTSALNRPDSIPWQPTPAADGLNAIVAMIARGFPLSETLDGITRYIESQSPGSLCSILLVEGGALNSLRGSAPSLPPEYTRLLHGLPIGPRAGSCGTAAWRGEAVIVENIEIDPLWEAYRQVAQAHGLKSCWSIPIFDSNSQVHGTFAIYHHEPRKVDPATLELVQRAAHIAGIALERERHEASIQAAEKRFRLVLDNSRDAIYQFNIDNLAFDYISPASREVLGYEPAEVEQVNFSRMTDLIHPDDLELIRGRIAESGTDSPEPTLEYRFLTPNRGYRWVSDTRTLIRDEAGKPHMIIGTLRDVTDRKLLEERLLQSQKMESIGRLAGGVAHDFNNLLTVIIGNLELAIPQADKPNMIESLREAQRAAERAAELTQQLLAFARKQLIQPRKLDLNDQIENTARLLRRLIGANIELVIAPQPGLWPIKADPVQLEQVVINLVVNARDAMPQGGRLKIATSNVTIDDEAARRYPNRGPGDYVVLDVSDNGVGIASEDRPHIFEPFFTTKETGRGTGMGLATCHGIIEQHGGHIDVFSEVGRGTTFKAYLPRAMEADAPVDLSPPAGAIPGGTETILLVEDEAGVRRITELALRKLGYRVIAAEHGEAALELLGHAPHAIDLLLTDVVMPGISGNQLHAAIRERLPELRVLYMSGYANNMLDQDGLNDAGADFLHKPFTVQQLAIKLRQALGR